MKHGPPDTHLAAHFSILPALMLCLAAQAAEPPLPTVAARAWLLMDVTSGQTLGAVRAAERFEPASLTKVMTAYIVFQALKEKRLAPEQTVSVSERAWKAGGSRMFVQPRMPVTVDELLHGMIVQSGNDACIALAEAVGGTEEAFVQHMNREAKRLGLANTHFSNSSGLTHPAHYSTAQDLAVLAAALIRDFPEQYQRYYSQKEYRYNNITQPNRNRLLWLDPNVDGVKTGYTDAAGYCLIASARRDKRRVLSVVLGASSESSRAQESQKLLNHAFLNYDDVPLYLKGKVARELAVWKGSERSIKAGVAADLYVTVPKGMANRLKAELVSQQPLIAPVSAGQRVGTIRVALEGKPLGEYPAVAIETVGAAGIFGRTMDTVRLWFK
jgi:D-alanyl-D-alanine carboxypeptidase (penicillin-binding protein 5/6)